jgi:hypothetical protein
MLPRLEETAQVFRDLALLEAKSRAARENMSLILKKV